MYRTLFYFIVFFAVSVVAQVEFPMASNIVNVTKDPYYAKGDGKTDDTEAILSICRMVFTKLRTS